MLRALGRQGVGAALPRHRRHRRHDHVRRRLAAHAVDLLGAAGDLAGRGLQPGSRHQRHKRVLTIDDTHRDIVLAVSSPQSEGYAPDTSRLVDFMGSYPPGDMVLGELRGPMAEETVSWLNRVALGVPTQAATAAEAHNRLMLTKALDLSAKRKQPVKLPLDPDEERRAA